MKDGLDEKIYPDTKKVVDYPTLVLNLTHRETLYGRSILRSYHFKRRTMMLITSAIYIHHQVAFYSRLAAHVRRPV